MVSDNREISLISSIKSTLNNISHMFIVNSLIEEERDGKRRGRGGGSEKHLFQLTFTFTFKTSKPNFKVEYLKNGTR